MIRGVTIIGDLLRPTGAGRPGGTDAPTMWLFNAVKRQVALASGLSVSIVSGRHLPEWQAWLEAERSYENSALFWAARYRLLADRTAFDRIVMPHLREQFCIGYELPPYLVAILEAFGIPFIDLRIHPVRFLDDLLFAARASDATTHAALLGMAVSEAEVIATAGLREAMCQLIGESSHPNDTLLVLGQRPMDSTQIVGDRFFDAMDQAGKIAALCAKYQGVVLKPHPLEMGHSLMTVTTGVARNLMCVAGDNLYRLLSTPQITAVLTVNSSAAYEAAYFGKAVYHLAPLPVRLAWRGDEAAENQHVSINDQVLTVDFWRTMLSPHTSVGRTDGFRLAPKPNRLRIALDSFWNFQEIDTDRIPPRR
jgi:hypothetical protein